MPPVVTGRSVPRIQLRIVVTGVSDDGTAVRGSFAEASGLEVELTPIEYRNGSEDITLRKIPGSRSSRTSR